LRSIGRTQVVAGANSLRNRAVTIWIRRDG